MKKLFGVFFACLICFWACEQKTVSHIVKIDQPKVSLKSDTTYNSEYIDWAVAKINGVVEVVSTKDELYRSMGKPDSIITPDMNDICVSYFDQPFKFVYIKGSQFELVGDKIAVSSLNFDGTDLKLIVGDLTFNAQTTLTSLAKLFPKSVKQQQDDTGEKSISIRLNTSNKPTDDALFLTFKNNKLVMIEYWMPC